MCRRWCPRKRARTMGARRLCSFYIHEPWNPGISSSLCHLHVIKTMLSKCPSKWLHVHRELKRFRWTWEETAGSKKRLLSRRARSDQRSIKHRNNISTLSCMTLISSYSEQIGIQANLLTLTSSLDLRGNDLHGVRILKALRCRRPWCRGCSLCTHQRRDECIKYGFVLL